jgi:hypothetical protein
MRKNVVIALLLLVVAACRAKEPGRAPRAAFVTGPTVHVIEAVSQKPVRDVKLAGDVIDLAWASDTQLAALLRDGSVHVVDDAGAVRPAKMPPADAWGSGPTNIRLVTHLEEQLEGDHDQEFGSDPYPSMARLVRVETGDVELVSCQFYDKPVRADGVGCQDWVWSTLDVQTLSFGRVSAAGPPYQNPDDHAAPELRSRPRPPTRAAPLAAPPSSDVSSTSR